MKLFKKKTSYEKVTQTTLTEQFLITLFFAVPFFIAYLFVAYLESLPLQKRKKNVLQRLYRRTKEKRGRTEESKTFISLPEKDRCIVLNKKEILEILIIDEDKKRIQA